MRSCGTVGTVIRSSRYAGTVRWYGAGYTVPNKCTKIWKIFTTNFSIFTTNFCTFHNEFLGTLRWYGGEVRWVRCTVPLYHHTVPLHRTVPDTVPHRRTIPPYRTPYRTQPSVPQTYPKPHSYVQALQGTPLAYLLNLDKYNVIHVLHV